MTLEDFLLARIAEDEAVARAAEADRPAKADVVYVKWQRFDTGWVPATAGEWVEGSRLFAQHDPTRVLAECEAKRRIVEEHSQAPFPTLPLLALPYADHPDYRPEWRP